MSVGDKRAVIAYWQGYYDACRRLTTSPRMRKDQVAVIEDQAWQAKAELEAHGVKFQEETRAR